MAGILKVLARNHSIARSYFDHTVIRESDFSNSDLTGCIFCNETIFYDANFTRAFLEDCTFSSRFSKCDFRYSSWRGVDACGSYFESCLFINVRFENCDLSRTRFRACIFINCTFADCDISKAHFSSSSSNVGSEFIKCDLYGIRLPELFIPYAITDSKNVPYIPMVCPDEGEFVGYKKAWAIDDGLRYPVLITLRIPADARRSSGFGRKCRCDKATVVKMEWVNPILHVHSNPTVSIARSVFDKTFVYTEGKEVEPRKGFCEDRWDACSGGIHFFMNKQEAIDY